jgi:hypothetical protein
MAGVVQSQDTYVAPGVPLSVIGGGGSIPENLMVSTLSALSISNISSINGVPYGGAALANANFSSISSFAIAASSINATNIDDIPYTYAQPQGLVDRTISSISLAAGGGILSKMIACGAPLTGFISTVQGHKYSVNGCMELSTIGAGGFTAPDSNSVNAYLSIWGGGGGSPNSWINSCLWTYPQISTVAQLTSGSGSFPNSYQVDLQWNAGGGFTQFSGVGASSTIRYYAYCSPDWPIPISVRVSTLVGQVATDDEANVTITDTGDVNISGTG